MRALAFAAVLLLSLSCGQKKVVAPFSYTDQVGWFHGPCLSVSGSQWKPGAAVTLIVLGESQSVRQARLQQQTDSSATCPALLKGRAKINGKPGRVFYTLEGGDVGATDMGIGLIGAVSNPAVANGAVRGDIDGDGRPEVFASCATSEGIKFSVWSEKAYQGEPRWSGYEYLDYELTPSCP